MRNTTHRGGIAKAALAGLTAALLLCLALATTALAGPPNHPRTPAEDIGGLDKACGAAVDTEGDVYAASAGDEEIRVYDPDHSLIATIPNANDPCGLAVNSHGELLVSEQGTGNVVLYVPNQYPLSASPTYGSAQPIDESGEAAGISIDADDTLFIAKGDRVEAYASSEVQLVRIAAATGGGFKLRFTGQETSTIPNNASAAEVQAALEALSNIAAGDVSVSLTDPSANNRVHRIEFRGALSYTDLPQTEAISSLTPAAAAAYATTSSSGGLGVDETQQITLSGVTGGSFKLKFEGQETTAIAFNAPARKSEGAGSVEAALEALSNIAPGDVSVARIPTGYAISFEAALAAKNVPQVETITELLPNETQKVTVDATAGAYNLVATTAVGIGTTTLGSKTVTGVSTSLGAYQVGDTISGPGMPLGATIAAVGAGTLEISANANASGVDKTLTATETTSAIQYDAFASTGEGAGSVEAALEALAGIGSGDVSVTGGPGGPGGLNPYLVTFEGAFGGRNLPPMTRKKAGITGDAAIATTVEGASIVSSTETGGWDGRIGAGDLGDARGVGAYVYRGNGGVGLARGYVFVADSATDEVKVFYGPQPQTLKLRKTIGGVDEDRNPETPDQELGFGPQGSAVGVDPANGHFLVFDADHSAADEFEATGEFLDQITDPGFEDAEPTALAVRRHQNEVQRINIDATGGSFRLELDGAQTGDIPIHLGQFPSAGADEVQAALDELPTVGKGASFVNGLASSAVSGIFIIGFKGGLGNRDVAQLGADSSGLTGGTHTATVVTMTQGYGPGSVYVGAGSGSGSELLAFGPLVTPSRALAPASSHVLTEANSVAVDGFGNVYAGTPTAVHVYSPTGGELTEFGLPQARGTDLAVDSEGRVYSLEGPAGSGGGVQTLTYYTPSAYPPTSGTSYSRHAPLLIAASLKSVAVNPANDHVFVRDQDPFGSRFFYELSSAKDGSTPLTNDFFNPTNNVNGLGVYGAESSVYMAQQGGSVVRVAPSGTEALGGISLVNDPSYVDVNNPRVAVDQSNGHALVFEHTSNVQEYEASGAFVAEFGEETHFGGGDGIAIDNACALHDPPLTEATTPTCAEFDPANGTVYVAHDDVNNTEFPYDITAYGPLSYGEPPAATTGAASGIGPAGATLSGTVDPRGFDVEECAFEYLTEDEYEQNLEDDDPAFAGASTVGCAESAGQIGAGSEPVDVHADLSGIEPQAKRYRFRLVARSQFGEGAGDAGLFGPPLLTTKTAQPVFYDEATFRAGIDPSGLETTYRFQYGSKGAGEYDQATLPATLEPGDGEAPVEAPVTGLAEGAEYHFRAVIENEAGTIEGPDQTFTTQKRPAAQSCPNVEYRVGPSTFLPDCRAYELVTPAETRGQTPASFSGSGEGFFNTSFVTSRGPDAGDSVAYGIGALPGFDGTGRGDGFRAERGAGAHPSGGWASKLQSFSFAEAGGSSPERHGISPDLGYWLLGIAAIETPSDAMFPIGNYLRVPAGTANPACSPDPALTFELVGCGEVSGAPVTDPDALGRYVSAGGTHMIIASKARLDDDAPPVGTVALYDRQAGSSNAVLISLEPDGAPLGAGEDAKYLAATEDGTAVAFEVDGALYLHRAGQTIRVADAPNTFNGLSADGKRVFYADAATPSIGTGPPPSALYACDTEAGPCAGPGAQAPSAIAANSTFVFVSPDGSDAFVSSEEALTAPDEENQNGEHAEAGERNLYAWDGAELDFVAVLMPGDFTSPTPTPGLPLPPVQHLGFWHTAVLGQGRGRALSPIRSTPDGEAVIFESLARLTAYDNGGRKEIYRYANGEILCLSCDPSGAPAGGDAALQSFLPDHGLVNTDTLIANITDDGRQAFFQSPDRLLPEDANGVVDVYEWKAPGAGDCTRPGGCLALISSGQGEAPSYLYGMTADGSDVFFNTPERLVSSDIASGPSIYDARVNGGIPDKIAAAPCQGDACQGEGTPAPAVPAAASTGAGAGNVSEAAATKPRCAKGKRRVKGRCVHKKSHKKAKRHHRRASHNGRTSR